MIRKLVDLLLTKLQNIVRLQGKTGALRIFYPLFLVVLVPLFLAIPALAGSLPPLPSLSDYIAADDAGLPAGYHGQDDTLQYNPYEDQMQRTQPGDELHYNPWNDRFEYHQPGYETHYNPYEDRWE